MKRKITAVLTIAILIVSNGASLFAGSHSNCKMNEQKDAGQCEMMDMKMDCCPSEQPASQACECPEMNNSQNNPELPPFIITKSLENPSKISLQFITLNHFEQATLKRLPVYSYNSLKPENKIYKSIQSFLI